MISREKLAPILASYKGKFLSIWKNEKYKWENVKYFQDRWNLDAENFGTMFEQATAKTANLLASGYAYPRAMIINFAKADDEGTRAMFRDLADESQDLAVRVEAFQAAAEAMRAKYDDGTWRNHYQNTNAISTYLWLMFPEKYYIYKYGLYQAVSKDLSSDYSPKANGSVETMIGGFKMYDEVCTALSEDEELLSLLRQALTPACHPDTAYKTLTIDFGHYVGSYYLDEKKAKKAGEGWIPEGYVSPLTVEDWKALLSDTSVFTTSSLQIMKRIKDYGGQATCTQLAVKYGESANFYNTGASTLAKRVAEVKGLPMVELRPGEERWWPILFLGKAAEKDDEGVFIWKLRNELSAALDQTDLSQVQLYENNSQVDVDKNQQEELQEETIDADTLHSEAAVIRWYMPIVDALRSFGGEATREEAKQFVIEKCKVSAGELSRKIKSGASAVERSIEFARNDLCYEGFIDNGQRGIWKLTDLGQNIIISEQLAGKIRAKWIRIKAAERYNRDHSEKKPIPLIDLTPYYRYRNPPYTKADFLSKVYMTEERFDVLVALLKNKKNIILQGAPGVGKTFTAKKLAYAIMEEVDDSRIEMVQFHQNYSYEDFVMGYRPDGADFKLTEGIFYRFCQTAANHPDQAFFFIIDEINRGNMSKIFGELLMLIDRDYRGTKATLAYSGMPFSVPENLYIIGMMNTADRSLAMIDYALRRRFSFFDMDPGFNSEGFVKYQEAFANETFNALINQVKQLNREILEDKSLGRGFQIGHSYFCGREVLGCTDEWMRSVVEFDLLPTLGEYWFDEPKKLAYWEKNLRGVFDD